MKLLLLVGLDIKTNPSNFHSYPNDRIRIRGSDLRCRGIALIFSPIVFLTLRMEKTTLWVMSGTPDPNSDPDPKTVFYGSTSNLYQRCVSVKQSRKCAFRVIRIRGSEFGSGSESRFPSYRAEIFTRSLSLTKKDSLRFLCCFG